MSSATPGSRSSPSIGIQFGYLLGGTIIVEEIFALPGMGRLVLTGIAQREYAVVQSTRARDRRHVRRWST